jgi:hypothetical protein
MGESVLRAEGKNGLLKLTVPLFEALMRALEAGIGALNDN